MERPAQVLAIEHPPEPTDLLRGPEERVIAKDVRVLSLNDVLDLAEGRGRGVADPLDVLRNEQEVVGIDMAVFDGGRRADCLDSSGQFVDHQVCYLKRNDQSRCRGDYGLV